jgi:hypothetical protein
MTTVNLSIQMPEPLADAAREAGLLTGDAVAALIATEMRRRDAAALRAISSRAPTPASHGLTDADIAADIQAEIDAMRAGKRAERARGA